MYIFEKIYKEIIEKERMIFARGYLAVYNRLEFGINTLSWRKLQKTTTIQGRYRYETDEKSDTYYQTFSF